MIRKLSILLVLTAALVALEPALYGQPSLGANSTISLNAGQVSFTCGTQLNPNGAGIFIGPFGHYAAVITECVLLADGNKVATFTCNLGSVCPPTAAVPVIPGAKYVTIANHYFILRPSGFGDWVDPFGFLTPRQVTNPGCTPPNSLPMDLTPASPVLPSPLPPPTCGILALLAVPPIDPSSYSLAPFRFIAEITSASINPQSISPKEITLGPKQQQQFTSVSNAIWTIDPHVGTITPAPGVPAPTGTYTAPTPIDTAQDVTVKACSVDVPGNCAEAIISLVPSQVEVSPHSASVLPGASQKLTVQITGAPNIDQTVVWSFDPMSPSNLGKIDASGTYTAPTKDVLQAPITVLIRGASKDDPSKFDTASIFTEPVTITVTGDADLLAVGGAQATYTATVVSPTGSAVTWTPITPPALGSIVPLTSDTAQFTVGTPPTIVTTTKIEACLTEDPKSFCSAPLVLTLSPQATISKVDPTTWPSGQQTAVTITGTGFGAADPTVSADNIGFTLTAFTFNTTIQGTVFPPIIPFPQVITVKVDTTSNPKNSEAKNTTVTVAPPTVTISSFPTAFTLLKNQVQLFTPTVSCKLANAQPCDLPTGPFVTCSINPNLGTVTPGPTRTCVYTASATIPGRQPGVVQLTMKTVFNPTIFTTATINLTPLNVTVTPTTQDVNGGASQKFTAAVTGVTSDSNSVVWSLATNPTPLGTLDQTGLYTAPNPVTAAQKITVKACSVLDTANACGTAEVSLVPISVIVTPSSVNLATNGTQQFSTTILGTSNIGVTWTLIPSVGTISASGAYTAPSTISIPQQVTVKACTAVTPAPPNPCGTAVVNLVPVPDFSVSATPTSQTVAPGGAAVYNVTVTPIAGFTGTVNFSCPVTPPTTAVTVSGCSNSISLASSPVSFSVTVTTVSSITLQNYTITATGTAGPLTHSSALTLGVGGPIPVFSPTPVSFPDQNPNTSSAPITLTLTNAGNAPLLISGASITGGDSSNFRLTNNCLASLAANTSCTFTVIFAPTAVRQFSGALTITDNAAGSPHPVLLTGKGVGPVPVFSATALVFGPQVVRVASAPQSIMLTNAGTTPISGISVGSGFLQTNTCGTSLPANASCTITVSFSPILGGLNLGNISVTGSTTVVSLTGSGIPTLTGLTPATVTAGSDNFTLGLAGDGFTRSAMVKVNGITRLAMPVDLQHLNVAIASSDVANIGSLSVSVVIPGTGGQESGALPLTVTSSPIPLIGNIVPARVLAGYQLPLKLIVNGSFFTRDSVVQINGAPRATIFISPSQLTAIVPITDFVASALPSITVVKPAAMVPANAASLAVFRYGDLTFDNTLGIVDLLALSNVLAGNNTPSDPAPGDLNLDGKADTQDLLILANFLAGNIHTLPVIADQSAFLFNAGATVTLSPPTFAGQIVGTPSDPLPVKFTNGGPTSLSITGIVTSPEFTETNDCGIALGGNGTCTIYLTFTPTAAGRQSGALTVQDNSTNGPHTATLSGFGIASAAPPSPPVASLSVTGTNTDSAPVLAFTSQTVGTASASQTLTLTNQGSTQLTISGIVTSSGNEFAQNNDCGSSLSANTSCTITVTFSPAATGTRTATLTVTDNASNSPQTANLSGTGSGLGGGGVTDGPPPPPPPTDN